MDPIRTIQLSANLSVLEHQEVFRMNFEQRAKLAQEITRDARIVVEEIKAQLPESVRKAVFGDSENP